MPIIINSIKLNIQVIVSPNLEKAIR